MEPNTAIVFRAGPEWWFRLQGKAHGPYGSAALAASGARTLTKNVKCVVENEKHFELPKTLKFAKRRIEDVMTRVPRRRTPAHRHDEPSQLAG
jgi:hypothetical protein